AKLRFGPPIDAIKASRRPHRPMSARSPADTHEIRRFPPTLPLRGVNPSKASEARNDGLCGRAPFMPRPAGRTDARRRKPAVDCRHRSEEHTSELQSRENLVCRLLLEKKKR